MMITLTLLSWNYVTLTNMSPKILAKIISMKISPLYISIHTTNSQLRKEMMRYKQDFDVMHVLRMFADSGIEYHTQLVLVPGINDGQELDNSLRDLTSSALRTIGVGVVPVGLTKHRVGLKELPLFTKDESIKVIETIAKYKVNFPQIMLLMNSLSRLICLFQKLNIMALLMK